MKYEMRLLAPDPDTILGDDVVLGLVGQEMPFVTDGGVLDETPTATITRAWVDDDGWVCAEVDVDYGGPHLSAAQDEEIRRYIQG